MGDILEFSINLDSPQLVFYPGQKLTGYVTLDLAAPVHVETFIVKLVGKGYCHWEDNVDINQSDGSSDYYGRESIIKKTVDLLCAQNKASGIHELSTGMCKYPFSFQLTGELPSSFEGTYGYIRYLVKAKIEKAVFDAVVTYPITVNDLIDTNDSKYSEATGGETYKDVQCSCFGKLYMNAKTDKSCYCPGEAIYIDADAQNKSISDMDLLYAQLVQTVTYYFQPANNRNNTSHKDIVVTKEIAKLNGPPVPSGQRIRWLKQAFGIPATPPTITNSKVITVSYQLKVKVAVQTGIEADVKLDIIIGTIPYVPSYGKRIRYGTPEDPQGPPLANFIDGASYPPPPPDVFGYPDMYPPSYSAAVGENKIHIGKENFNTDVDIQYIPLYTFAMPYIGPFGWFEILKFSITFDSKQLVFYPGQTVSGYVTLELAVPLEIKSINVKLTGKCYCYWKESRVDGKGKAKKKRQFVDYVGKESVIRQTKLLFDARNENIDNNNNNNNTNNNHNNNNTNNNHNNNNREITCKIPAGKKTFPFSFDLTEKLPSSYEGELGYIRYLVKSKIEKPDRNNAVVNSAITINELIDANNSMYAQGQGGEFLKEIRCFCYKGGQVEMNANIDRNCYCPGETIIINAEVQNKTNTDMYSLHAKLIQIVTYNAQRKNNENRTRRKRKSIRKQIAILTGPLVLKGKTISWVNQAFGIPAATATITQSSVITVHYNLKVMVALPVGIEPAINMHITIGTIPHLLTSGTPVKYGTPEDPQGPPAANVIYESAYNSSVFGNPPFYSAGVGEKNIYIGKYLPRPRTDIQNYPSGDCMVMYEYMNMYTDMQYIPVYTFVKPQAYAPVQSTSEPTDE